MLTSAFGSKKEEQPAETNKADETCFFECADDTLMLAEEAKEVVKGRIS